MRRNLNTAAVIATVTAAGALAVGASYATAPADAAPGPAKAAHVCAVQRHPSDRRRCLRYWDHGQLRAVPPSLALDITGGKSSNAYAHYGDTTYVYAANGREYTS